MAPRIFHLALTLVLVVSLAGCRNAAPQQDEFLEETVPEEFHLAIGEGGGFAGRWQGYHIERDGTVTRWKGVKQGDDPEQVGTLDPEQLAALWQKVQEAEFFHVERTETGNMTAYMEIRTADRQHRVSWIPRFGGIEPVTDPVERLYIYIRETARTAGSTGR